MCVMSVLNVFSKTTQINVRRELMSSTCLSLQNCRLIPQTSPHKYLIAWFIHICTWLVESVLFISCSIWIVLFTSPQLLLARTPPFPLNLLFIFVNDTQPLTYKICCVNLSFDIFPWKEIVCYKLIDDTQVSLWSSFFSHLREAFLWKKR